MYDLVSFGDIVIDLFFKGETLTFKDNRFQLAVGGKYFVDHFSESLGGGGANVAVGTAHFGLNTAICGKVGENVFKQIIIQKLIKKNVSTEFLLHEKQYLNLSSIYLTEKGERSIVNYQTHDTAFFINPVLMDNMIKTKCVYMGNLPDTPIEEKIIILKRFKENNVKTILNIGVNDCRKGKKDLEHLLEMADIFIINRYEYADIVKKEAEKLDLEKDCANEIKFDKKVLVITDSSKGSYLYHDKKIIHQKALEPNKILDTTGAGDAFTSGFISGYLKEESLEDSMKQGAQYACDILGKYGAQ